MTFKVSCIRVYPCVNVQFIVMCKCNVLSCEWCWPTRKQTVRAGAHGVIYPKCVKAKLNFCGSLIVAILSGSEFQSFIVLGKKEYL